ncbi:redoxin family protein [Paenibacillus radicis (ex Xue et al. 2023)]|uniref:Redoxin family protein n=1 Tax=Paenibacillus radicis (ex Xue et al. 2023) TaxID=2972489 RepID=A0ABT1YFZ6_9BACL|nr:redoxin family protein [Paenibacillus radicis (ex Xue et al. 2023)]MCR8632122.1 redoxin family protein [Paenibacillus radicis (ex Xue et al. 2023)]
MLIRKWPIAIITLFSLLLILAACGNKETALTAQAGQTTLNKGSAAPMFDLKDLDGNKVTLASLAGEKVYVKYWASWCPICLAGMDELNTLAGQSNGFKVITIVSPNFKGEQSSEDFVQWFKALQADHTGNNIKVLLDENGTFAQKFGIRGYPTSLYIGSDGVLVNSVPGHNPNDVIKDTFKVIS